ncbi:MAG: Hsp20/alpha crystallin family protein [Anaerolineaceae bacterium]|nr:Hsp20/alpha crystallin family protein [Anaerolineaceae bacterium]
MAINDLLPWKKDNSKVEIERRKDDSYMDLQSQLNRLFDDFFTNPFSPAIFGGASETSGNFIPRIDVSETDKEIKVSAEVPGLDENDIKLTLANNVLTISGQKESKREDKDSHYHRIERSFGSFRRDIPLPEEVDEERVAATFAKGVLTVVMPKSGNVSQGRRIPIRKG